LLLKVIEVVAIYLSINLAKDSKAKIARRLDLTIIDFIGDTYASISRLYFNPIRLPSITDIRVSLAYFTKRKALLSRILLIRAKYNMFCYEDETIADKLTKIASSVKAKTTSR
jgi:hypothetical protein